jgi:hypothetical protein
MPKRPAKSWRKIPTLRADELRADLAFIAEARISAIFPVWHGVCIWVGIPGTGPREGKGTTNMTLNLTNALAGFAAFTLSVLCMATAIIPASPAGLLA